MGPFLFTKTEKEIHETISAAMPAGTNSLPFQEISFNLILKMQLFMWIQGYIEMYPYKLE